ADDQDHGRGRHGRRARRHGVARDGRGAVPAQPDAAHVPLLARPHHLRRVRRDPAQRHRRARARLAPRAALNTRPGRLKPPIPRGARMAEAYIIDTVRTPVGRRNGGLSKVHPADMGAHAIKALLERTGIDPAAVDDVMFGCVDALGPQAGDIARTCWLAAGLPEHVPGVTIDRQCGSSQQAISLAAQSVMAGVNDLVVTGGVQSMSMIPIGYALTATADLGFSDPFSGSEGWVARYGTQEVSQFRGAELIAEKWDISREEMERFAF